MSGREHSCSTGVEPLPREGDPRALRIYREPHELGTSVWTRRALRSLRVFRVKVKSCAKNVVCARIDDRCLF